METASSVLAIATMLVFGSALLVGIPVGSAHLTLRSTRWGFPAKRRGLTALAFGLLGSAPTSAFVVYAFLRNPNLLFLFGQLSILVVYALLTLPPALLVVLARQRGRMASRV